METMNMKDFEVKKEIIDEIKKWDKIIIHRHVRPDPDAIGSQTGLAELIKSSFPKKTVLTAGGNVGDLAFLAKPDSLSRDDYEEALVIVTDTADIARIDGEGYKYSNKWIKIDHHPLDESYGDIEWVNTHASSCSEMITDLWITFKAELSLSDNGARLLYGGIVGDTGRFQYDATTPYTMQLTAELMKFNFRHTALLNELYAIKPPVATLMGHVLKNARVSEEGVAHVILTKKTLDNLGINDSDTSSIVGLLGTIENVLSWGIFVEQEDGTFRCRLRSKGPTINQIAKEHDGGGHPLASGANAQDRNEIDTILEKLTNVNIKWKNNRDSY